MALLLFAVAAAAQQKKKKTHQQRHLLAAAAAVLAMMMMLIAAAEVIADAPQSLLGQRSCYGHRCYCCCCRGSPRYYSEGGEEGQRGPVKAMALLLPMMREV